MNFIKGLFIGTIATSTVEAIFYYVPYLKANFWDNPKLIFGYHIHHSFIGLLFVVAGLIFWQKRIPKGIALIGLGLGIILVHTISDGRLIFIE